MTFMNDNDFMVELTEEELTDVNGAGGFGIGGCGSCGFSVPFVSGCSSCGCSSCGFGGFSTGPFISAYSNVSSNTFTYNLSIASSNVNKTSYFTMIG